MCVLFFFGGVRFWSSSLLELAVLCWPATRTPFPVSQSPQSRTPVGRWVCDWSAAVMWLQTLDTYVRVIIVVLEGYGKFWLSCLICSFRLHSITPALLTIRMVAYCNCLVFRHVQYLRSVRPLMNDEEYSEIEQLAKNFLVSVGCFFCLASRIKFHSFVLDCSCLSCEWSYYFFWQLMLVQYIATAKINYLQE